MSAKLLSPSQPAEPEPLLATATAAPGSKGERITDKDAATKLARERLNVLQLAQELGSVSKACKQGGMDRTSFYEWKRRFQLNGSSWYSLRKRRISEAESARGSEGKRLPQ